MTTKMEHFPSKNPNPVLSVKMNGTVLYSNEAAKPLLIEWGVRVGEKLLLNIVDLVQRVIARNSPEKLEVKAGNRVYLISLHHLPEEECVNIYGFDISDEKEFEEKLRESEEKYRDLIETAIEGIWILDAEFRTNYVNKKMAEILGYSQKEMIDSFAWDFSDEECKAIIKQNMEKRRQGINKIHEIKFIHKDGSPLWVHLSSKSLFDNRGKFTGVLGMFNDITERKQAEEALCEAYEQIQRQSEELQVQNEELQAQSEELQMQNEELQAQTEEVHVANKALSESERKYHLLFENMLDGFAYCKMLYDDCGHSVDFIYFDTNSAFERLTGLKGVKGKKVTEAIPGIKESHPGLFDIYGRVALTGQPERFEIEFKPLGIWLSISVYSTEREHFVAVFDDITDRKKADEALRKAHDSLEVKVKERTADLEQAYESLKESEKSLAEAQEMAHIGNWSRNLVTNELYWSNEMYRIYGLNPESGVTYNMLLSHLHPEDRDYVDNAVKGAIKGKPFDIDHRIISGDGEERIVHARGKVTFDEKNIPIWIRGTVQDITERKETEEKIESLAHIVEYSNDAIGTMSLDGIITNWNKGAEQFYGYSVEEILGKSISTLAPSHLDKETIKLIEKVKLGEKIQHYETIRLRKNGKMIYVSFTLSPVFDSHGKMTAVSFISSDITKRKEAEESLANIELARKKEIHHRIKNNLQVISSLLDLQAEKFKDREEIKDSEVLDAFMESQNRVISMALIHEELYKGGAIDTLNFSPYIEELANSLFQTYWVGNSDISLKMDFAENVFFDMDTAVPLGIIVNEIVSNSLKHAFIGRDKGEVRIRLHREENGECKTNDCNSSVYVLSISDNGIGIPKDLDIEDLDSLGLQLVTTLVDQLDGELELKRDNGTEFIIRFTVRGNNDQALSPTQQQLADNE